MNQNLIVGKTPGKRSDFIAVHFEDTQQMEHYFKNLPPDLVGWANLYLKFQVEGIKAEGTLKLEKYSLNNFIEFFSGYHTSTDIRHWLPKTTQRFIEELSQKGRKPQTINRNLVTIRTFARWVILMRPDIFPLGDPTKGIRPPTQDALKPKGLDERQVKKVIDAAYHLICEVYPDSRVSKVDKEPWYTKAHRKMKRPFRDYAIIMLLINGGLRRQEICELRLNQLKGKHLKNIKCKGNLYRDVLLGRETLLAIQGYISEERDKDVSAFPKSSALFLPSSSRKHRNQSGALSARSINVIVKKIENAANTGVKPGDQLKLHPHMFRHTHAYQILKKGKSLPYLQKRLGHQSMNYLALYAQMPENEEKELLDSAEFK